MSVIPSEDTVPELSPAQKGWLDERGSDPQVCEVGPCRWIPGGVLIVEVETVFDRATFVIDREGTEL